MGHGSAQLTGSDCPNPNDPALPPECSNSVSENASHSIDKVKVFPNPFSGNFTVEISLNESQPIEICMSSLLGQNIFCDNLGVIPTGNFSTEINPSKYSLASGIYFLQIRTENGLLAKRLLKI
jgi:hypothetical protein